MEIEVRVPVAAVAFRKVTSTPVEEVASIPALVFKEAVNALDATEAATL